MGYRWLRTFLGRWCIRPACRADTRSSRRGSNEGGRVGEQEQVSDDGLHGGCPQAWVASHCAWAGSGRWLRRFGPVQPVFNHGADAGGHELFDLGQLRGPRQGGGWAGVVFGE